MDLRTDQSFSWAFRGSRDTTFVREVFARDTTRDLGQPYTRSRYDHLYINGQYWGLYQTEERPDADFGATYFGGDPDDYDVIRPETGQMIGATDGDLEAWHRLWEGVKAPGGLASDEAYFRLQGRNADGSPNPAYENLLDVDNLIDYMLTIIYTGNFDGPISQFDGRIAINNFHAIRNRNGGQGFQFIMRDAEFTLSDRNENRNLPVPFGPSSRPSTRRSSISNCSRIPSTVGSCPTGSPRPSRTSACSARGSSPPASGPEPPR